MASNSLPCNENMDLRWYKTEQVDNDFKHWLEQVVFPDDCFREAAFESGASLYHFDLNRSLLEQVVHYGVPSAGFTEAQLNAAIREACNEVEQSEDVWWFHVNVHDGIVRVVEKFGRYNYSYPLVPIYILLNHHQAEQGGTTYAGLVSPHRSWMLLFDCGNSISVHGSHAFVRTVVRKVRGT